MSGTHLAVTDSPGLAGLRRASGRRRVAGVCAGLSRATGIDVQLVRIAIVVLALGGGVGVALYGCAWALLPRDDETTFPLGRASARAAGWSMHRRLQVTAIACFLTWLLFSSWSPFAIVPVVVAVLLLVVHHQLRPGRHASELRGTAPSGGASTPVLPASADFAAAAAAWQARLAQVNHGQTGVDAVHTAPLDALSGDAPSVHGRPVHGLLVDAPPLDAAPVPRVAGNTGWATSAPAPGTPASGSSAHTTGGAHSASVTPRRRDRRRRLAWDIAVALSAWLVGALVGLFPLHQSPLARSEVQLSAALAVVGAGLVLAGLRGVRPRLLTPLGLVLVLVLAADHTGLASPRSQWLSVQTGSGTASDPLRFVGTRAVHALPSSGDVTVQCRAADLTLTSTDDVQVQVDYRLRAADLTMSGDHLGGSLRGTARTTGPGTHLVRVDLDAAACHVEVRHA